MNNKIPKPNSFADAFLALGITVLSAAVGFGVYLLVKIAYDRFCRGGF